MSVLKTLSFTAAPQRAIQSPAARRRTKLIGSLEKQLALAKDPMFVAYRSKWVVGEDGVKRLVERPLRVRPWWVSGPDGKVVLTVRYGAKPIEFEKGKSGISVSSAEGLPDTLQALISAIQEGELDQLLAKAATGPGRRPKAA